MELVKNIIPEQVTYGASSSLTLEAGQNLKIETSPNGQEILDATVPTGKTWRVGIHIVVAEE